MVEDSFAYPEDCEKDGCLYSAEWKCRKSTNQVKFKLKAKVNEEEWLAIGFSEDDKMVR